MMLFGISLDSLHSIFFLKIWASRLGVHLIVLYFIIILKYPKDFFKYLILYKTSG